MGGTVTGGDTAMEIGTVVIVGAMTTDTEAVAMVNAGAADVVDMDTNVERRLVLIADYALVAPSFVVVGWNVLATRDG
jgi:hypothetical protein